MQGHTTQRNGRQGEGVHLRGLWNFALRNRALSFGIPTLVVAATVLFVLLVTPVYEAYTTIRIDEQKSNLAVLDALKSLSSGSEINTEMEVLRSRTLAEDVIDALDLNVVVKRPKRVPRSALFERLEASRTAPEASYRFRRQEDGRFRVTQKKVGEIGTFAIGEPIRLDGVLVVLGRAAAEEDEIRIAIRLFEDAVRDFRRTLSVSRPNREANIILVRYEGTDRELVQAVPAEMAKGFLEGRDRVRRTEAISTVRFLSEQLDTLAGQLIHAEQALQLFRESANVVDLEAEGKMYVDRLGKLLAERDMLDAEREALARLLDEVQAADPYRDELEPSPYRRLIAFPSLLRNFAVSELFRSMAEVENQRAELLNRRTLEDPDVQVLTRRIRELEDQLRTIAVTYLEGLTNHVASLDASLVRFRDQLGEVPEREIRFLRLMRETEVLEEIYLLLQTRLKEAQIAAAVEDPSVRVVDPSILPVRPIRPKKKLSVVLAVGLGLVLGLGAAFVRENMDTRLRTREELQELTDGVPVLGLIPRIPEAVNGRVVRRAAPDRAPGGVLQARLVAGRDPRSPISEAYRSLRTNISFATVDRVPKTLVFTSALPGDGKSTSSSNLAITLAQQELRCLLVDADMRRGVLNEVLGVRREPGLSNVLLGRAPLEDAIQRIELGEGVVLDFLPTGTLPPNPAELVGSERMRALLERLEASYDAVILDAPPLNAVTDAALLGTNADGVIVVARAGVTDRAAVAFAMEQLRNVRAPVLGTVLNDIDVKRERYYGSYGALSYYYSYAGAEEADR